MNARLCTLYFDWYRFNYYNEFMSRFATSLITIHIIVFVLVDSLPTSENLASCRVGRRSFLT